MSKAKTTIGKEEEITQKKARLQIRLEKLKFHYRFFIILLIVFVSVLIPVYLVGNFYATNSNSTKTTPTSTKSRSFLSDPNIFSPSVKTFQIEVGQTESVDLSSFEIDPEIFSESANLIFKDGVLIIKGDKAHVGRNILEVYNEYKFLTLLLDIEIYQKEVNWEVMEKDIRDYLSRSVDSYGIKVTDTIRNESMSINEAEIIPPASSAKITIAILVMRDVDAGKYTLEDTYPIQFKYKHSLEDTLGELENGTEVPIGTYVEKLIIESNNTAWYHLVHMLGDSYEVVNPRTIDELGVNPLFLDPYLSTAGGFAKVMEELYRAETVSVESRDYLIDLMMNAYQFNREGVGLGLPEGVEYANKLGYHWTDDLINFNDVAIIYGEKTDYVIAIIDKNIDWITGKENLKQISKIVYGYLNE